jgi:PAS domain S-box-containing protein
LAIAKTFCSGLRYLSSQQIDRVHNSQRWLRPIGEEVPATMRSTVGKQAPNSGHPQDGAVGGNASSTAEIDACLELVAAIDPQGTAFVTDQLGRLLGYLPGQLTGTALDAVFDAAEIRDVITTVSGALASDLPLRFSFQARQGDGQLRTLDLIADRFPCSGSPSGVLLRADGLFGERLQQALDRSEKRYRALVAHSTDIISVLASDGTWLESSEAGTRLLGYPKGYDPEGGIFSVVHDDDLSKAAAALQEVVDGRRGPTEPVEFRIRAMDGSWRIFESFGQNLTDDPDIQGVLIVSSDITNRKRAERALAESEERFRVLAEAASEGVCIAVDLRIESANSTFAAMYGYELSEVVGMSVETFVEPEAWPDLQRHHETGEAVQGEFLGVRKDGTTFPALGRGRTVRYQGQNVRVVTITDLTDQKRSAALEERRRIARNLHDGLTQELHFVGSQLRALIARHPALSADLLGVERASERALDEARRAITVLSGSQPEPLRTALADTAQDLADRHGLGLTLQLEDDLELSPQDTENLLRIVREAMGNAARHGQARFIEIRLWRDDSMHLAISDDGVGFDTTAPTRGFGLISMRERATAIEGVLTVTSTPGRGTEVALTLP